MTYPPRAATPEGQAGLDALLSSPQHALVGTDFDGTLAPIVTEPRDARALPGAVPALTRLAGYPDPGAYVPMASTARLSGCWESGAATMLATYPVLEGVSFSTR